MLKVYLIVKRRLMYSFEAHIEKTVLNLFCQNWLKFDADRRTVVTRSKRRSSPRLCHSG